MWAKQNVVPDTQYFYREQNPSEASEILANIVIKKRRMFQEELCLVISQIFNFYRLNV